MGSRLREELRRDRYSNVRTSIANDYRGLNYYSGSGEDDSGDEARREELEQEDQERALSELHGEASEGVVASEKRKKETDEEVAKQLSNEGRRKRARITLLPKHLIESNGIIRIPIDFAKAVRYHRKKRDIVAAAAYSSRLINSYRNFCEDIFPSMAFEDVLLKIEQLGSKKEVKGFLKEMRDSQRNKLVESLYGKEKAEKMIVELESGLSRQNSDPEVDGNAQDNIAEEPEASEADGGTESSNDSNRNPDQGVEASSDVPVVSPNQGQPSPVAPTDTSGQSAAKPLQQDDDEDEATFDDILGFQDKLANAAKDVSTTEREDNNPEESVDLQSTTASGTQDNPQSLEQSTEKASKDEDSDEEEVTFEDVLAVQDELVARDDSADDLTSSHDTKDDRLYGKEVPLIDDSDTGAKQSNTNDMQDTGAPTESLDDTTSDKNLDMQKTATSGEDDSSPSSRQPTETTSSQKMSDNDEQSDNEEEATFEDVLGIQDKNNDAESEQIGTSLMDKETGSKSVVAPSGDNMGDSSSYEDSEKDSGIETPTDKETAFDSGSS